MNKTKIPLIGKGTQREVCISLDEKDGRTSTFLTVSGVAALLGVSRSQVYRLFDDGLKWVQLGGVRRVADKDLADYINVHTHCGGGIR